MELLRRLDTLSRRPWFGDASLGLVCLGIVLVAAWMTPSDTVLSLFGYEVPVLCTFRNLTGLPCPGCGLTRSFTYMAHGQVVDAFRMNIAGPLAFVAVALQVPWRAIKVARIVSRR